MSICNFQTGQRALAQTLKRLRKGLLILWKSFVALWGALILLFFSVRFCQQGNVMGYFLVFPVAV